MKLLKNELTLDIFNIVACLIIVAIWPLWFNWVGVGLAGGMFLAHAMNLIPKVEANVKQEV